jgi:hypothetical protein
MGKSLTITLQYWTCQLTSAELNVLQQMRGSIGSTPNPTGRLATGLPQTGIEVWVLRRMTTFTRVDLRDGPACCT